MTLKHRIPVEPLEEERLANIERRIVLGAAERLAAPDRAPRRLFGFAGAALAAAAAMVVGWHLRGEPTQVAALPPAETAQTFAIHTSSEHSTVELDGASIATDPASALEVTRSAERVVVHMTRGRIELAVAHREGRAIVVDAGDTEIEDVGTKFSVEYDGASKVDVRVTEGEVKVTRGGKHDLVAAGFAWSSTDGAIVAIVEVPASPTPAAANPGAPTVATAPTVTLHDRAAAVPPPPAAVAIARPRVARADPPPPAPAPVHTVEHAQVQADPYLELKQAVRRQPIELDPKVDGPGDAAAEVAKLKPIAYAPQKYGEEASRALYEIAVLLHKPLHQDVEALRTLDFYRSRFGSRGKELAAALWLRVRITCSHAIDDECREAAYSYQRAVPTGSAADVAIRITNAQ
ncbi:MAG TPA: FecR family protein [Kofleriaceae bacterium]|nr:FecR family protein [Kofleriaceae bacterium]